MRVITGTLRGRRLRMPADARVRPTADRVKEGLFNALGPLSGGGAALDLFAGSGSLGIEALSRGVSNCTFVERSRVCCTCLRGNLKELGLTDRGRILRMPVERALPLLEGEGLKYGLVFSDPPYFQSDTQQILNLIANSDILMPLSRVVIEHHRDTSVSGVKGRLTYQMTKRYGDSAVSFLVCNR